MLSVLHKCSDLVKIDTFDIQGPGYSLYDPEICTTNLIHEGEVFFCCENLPSISIDTFKKTKKTFTRSIVTWYERFFFCSCLINGYAPNFVFFDWLGHSLYNTYIHRHFLYV